MPIAAWSIFGTQLKIALTGVHTRIRESIAKRLNWCAQLSYGIPRKTADLILLTLYFLLKLTYILAKSAYRQFKKYIGKITIHLKLDYQVSICSLIPPATAISKTQDRANTSVWWKLPFSIFFIIYFVQSAIINKVCKPELWFLCSAHPIIVLYTCMKFHENISNNF